MPEEYNYFQKIGAVPNSNPQSISLPINKNFNLELIHVPCTLMGLCEGVLSKPLLCRLYPFLPLLNKDYELEGLSRATIYDLTFDAIQSPSPCTVQSKEKLYLEKWRNSTDCLLPLHHPYIVLYLQAAKYFSQNYLKKLQQSEKLRGKTGKDFWRAWEFEYLSGELLDVEALTDSISSVFNQLQDKYGVFY